MATYIKVDGAWKPVSGDTDAICGYVKVDGAWRTVTNSYVKVGTDWRTVCAPIVVTPTPTPTPSPGGGGGGGGGDPAQDSSISNLSPSNGAAGGGYTVTVNGSFPSNFTNLSVNGNNLGSYTRVSSSQYSFTMPAGTAGSTVPIQAFNGRVPVMSALTFTYNSTEVTPTCANATYCFYANYTDGSGQVTANGNPGSFSVATEACGNSGTRTKAYTCVTGPYCANYGVAAGTCTGEIVPETWTPALSGWHLCTDNNRRAPSSVSPCINTTSCLYNGASGDSCPDPNACTSTETITAQANVAVSTSDCPSGFRYRNYYSYSGCPTNPGSFYLNGGCTPYTAPVTCGSWITYGSSTDSCCSGTSSGTVTTLYQYRTCSDGSSPLRESAGACSGLTANSTACGYVPAPVGCTCNYSGAGYCVNGVTYAPECCTGTGCCTQGPACGTGGGGGSGSGGGGGCIVGSTQVLTPTGYIKAEDLKVGDTVSSIRFEELSDNESRYVVGNWSSNTLTPIEIMSTTIRSIKAEVDSEAYISLNGDLFTPEHPILIELKGFYQFAMAGNIPLGAKVLKLSGDTLGGLTWETITSNEVILEPVKAYLFDTEDQDVLFTKGMLTHNLKVV